MNDRNFVRVVGSSLLTLLLCVSVVHAVSLPNGTAVFETSLASRISSTDTTMTLVTNSAGGETVNGYDCFTIDEGLSTAEYVCGTVSGTSVTGLERGLSFANGTTTSSTRAFTHRVGSDVKKTDFPLIQRLRNVANGNEGLPGPISYASHPTFTSPSQLVDLQQLNDTAFGSTPVIVTAGGTGVTSVASGGLVQGNGTSALSVTFNPTVGTITATTTTATSTFSGGLTVGQSETVGGNIIVSGNVTVTGNVTAGSVSGLPSYGITGDGSDGVVTITSGTTTLSHDMYYQNLTVNSGAGLVTNGWRVFATGTVSIAGTVDNSGANGGNGGNSTTNTSGAAAGIGAATTTGWTVGIGGGACNGSNATSGGSVGSNGTSTNQFVMLGGTGGAGGNGGNAGNTGSAGGSVTAALTPYNIPHNLLNALDLKVFSTTTTQLYIAGGQCGAGGGAGGGTGGSGGSGGGGGGGGAGGGVLLISASAISVTGLLQADGGNGGNGGSGFGSASGGGGGGGGGGGFMVLIHNSYTNNGTVRVSGGAGGSVGAGSSGTPVAGSAGAAGNIYTLKLQ